MQYFSTYDFASVLLDAILLTNKSFDIFTLGCICKTWFKIISGEKFKRNAAAKLKQYHHRFTHIPIKDGKRLLHGYNIFNLVNIIFDYGKITKITNKYRAAPQIRKSGDGIGMLVQGKEFYIGAYAYISAKDDNKSYVHYVIKDDRNIIIMEYRFLITKDQQLELIAIIAQPKISSTAKCICVCVNERWYLQDNIFYCKDNECYILNISKQEDIIMICNWLGLYEINIV